MKIAHFSDTHGLPRKIVPDGASLIVHSGDLFPNKTRGSRDYEVVYQTEWLRKTMPHWKAWSRGLPIVLVNGNHDYIDPAAIFREHGVVAFNVGLGPVTLLGLRFSGLPNIPWMGGEWNHEIAEDRFEDLFDGVLRERPDVLVMHCPPYGVLDDPYPLRPDYRIGSTAVANALTYKDHRVKTYLCGHCHERGGRREYLMSTLVCNAATTRMVVDV